MQASYLADPQAPIGAGLSSVFTAGFPASYFLSAPDRIRFSPVYTDGQQMAYMTTDVWVNFREIWLQPLYVFVSAWNERPPRPPGGRTSPGWPRSATRAPSGVRSGASTTSWSPRTRRATASAPLTTCCSSGLPVFPGQARLLTLQPPGGIAPEDPSTVLLPELRAPGKVGGVREQAVWVEGESQERLAMDFGENRFEWNERYEILEQPLFFFFTRATDGQWLPLTSVPRVGGTGPLFERRPAIAPNNRPRFGSNWRLWSVRLPPTARLFVPPRARRRVGGAQRRAGPPTCRWRAFPDHRAHARRGHRRPGSPRLQGAADGDLPADDADHRRRAGPLSVAGLPGGAGEVPAGGAGAERDPGGLPLYVVRRRGGARPPHEPPGPSPRWLR